MDGSFLIPIGFFAMIAAIVLVPRYFRNKERQDIQATVRAAIDKGQDMPADLIEAISRDVRPAPSPARDVRAGIIWLGVAIGFAVFGYCMGFYDEDASFPFYGIAAFPGFIGLALLVLGLIGSASAKKP